MSFRPTIAVYIDGQIADLGYYRDWDASDLFFEAITIAAIFHHCKSIEEYRNMKYGSQQVHYILDPAEIENTQENLKEIESWSEYPILIDLSAGYIYHHVGCLIGAELEKIPLIDVEKAFFNVHPDYDYILEHHKIQLNSIDFDKVKKVLLASSELQDRLSRDTLSLLREDTVHEIV